MRDMRPVGGGSEGWWELMGMRCRPNSGGGGVEVGERVALVTHTEITAAVQTGLVINSGTGRLSHQQRYRQA